MRLVGRGHSKVNLHLAVGDARPDGYHELETVFQSLSLCDELTLEPSPVTTHRLHVTGLGAANVPTDERNLVWKALDLMDTEAKWQVNLNKGIPTAGGMAGGSADAAATLRLLNEVRRTGGRAKSEEELHELAAQLGSDIPFTLMGGTAVGTGRGEKLRALPTSGNYHWALAFNDKGLSTPAVFRKLDEMRAENPELERVNGIDELQVALEVGDPLGVAKQLANDLQAPALALLPELGETLAAGEQAGALRGVVSGSGPTCAFLCATAEVAQEVATTLIDARLSSSSATAMSPAPGAILVDFSGE